MRNDAGPWLLASAAGHCDHIVAAPKVWMELEPAVEQLRRWKETANPFSLISSLSRGTALLRTQHTYGDG